MSGPGGGFTLNTTEDRKGLAVFLAIAFGAAWPLFLAPRLMGEPDSQAFQMTAALTWSLAMWAPGAAAIAVTYWRGRRPLESLRLNVLGSSWLPYIAAWFLPPALIFAAFALAIVSGMETPDYTFSAILQEGGPDLPEDMSPAVWVTGGVILAILVAPFFNMLFAMGEELGWRGYLLRQWAGRGPLWAIAATGAVWGLWHAPAIMLGLNYPGHPVVGIPLMILFCTLFGAVLSWLYVATRSPWAPALAHGAINASAGLPLLFLPEPDMLLSGTIASLLGCAVVGLFLLWLVGAGWLQRAWAAYLIEESGGEIQDFDAGDTPPEERE